MVVNELALVGGLSIPIPGTPLLLEPPTLELIAMLGDDAFYECMKFCRVTKDVYLDKVKEVYPEKYEQAAHLDELDIFISLLEESPGLKQQTIIAFEMLFPGKKIGIEDRMMYIGSTFLDSENFKFIQMATSIVIGLSGQAGESEFIPGNDAAKEIAAKIKRGRERVAAEKKASNPLQEEGTKQSISGYVSALAVGLRMPIQQIMKYTLYQLYDQLKRFSRQQSADTALKAMLAGAKDVKAIDWIGTNEDKK